MTGVQQSKRVGSAIRAGRRRARAVLAIGPGRGPIRVEIGLARRICSGLGSVLGARQETVCGTVRLT
jgi:hypothetical protein